MANSTTNNNAWEDFFSSMPSPSATLPASLSPDSQSLDRVSLGEPRDLAEVQGWFSNAEINMNNLSTIVEDSVPRRPSVQRSPKMLGDAVSPRRNSQMYVLRTEFVKEIRGLMEKLNKLQESVRDVQTKLQMVASNHEKLSCWTVDMEGAVSDLARQLVEKIGQPMAEEDEWHMPEVDQLHH